MKIDPVATENIMIKKQILATTQTSNMPWYGFTIYYTLYKHWENEKYYTIDEK